MRNNKPGFIPILGEDIFEKNVFEMFSFKSLKLLTIFFLFCSLQENDSSLINVPKNNVNSFILLIH